MSRLDQHLAPPSPSRVRIVRPSFYRSSGTGRLAPDVRDLLFGLTTLADDEGWMLWRPDEIAATLYNFDPHARRMRSLERRVAVLVAVGLLILSDCGCAYLPTLKEHHAVKGGIKNTAIWAWHQAHYVALHSATDEYVSDSVSSSVKDSVSSSSRAGDAAPDGSGAACPRCLQFGTHRLRCPDAPWMLAVAGA